MRVGPEEPQEPRRLLDAQPRIRPLPQRTVEQEDARWRLAVAEADGGAGECAAKVERRKVVGIVQLAKRHQAGSSVLVR